jgi:RNA polymerase sigma factor (TIGR02999 family)
MSEDSTEHRKASVTGLLVAWGQGDERALEQLTPIVYRELRNIARRYMRGERAEHTLQATALVHEAYLKLVDIRSVRWQNRAHFLAMAARLMRRILVDVARSRGYQKRGAGAPRVTFDPELPLSNAPARDVVALNDALDALATVDARKAQIVELRFFGGLSVEETAVALDVSPQTVMRDWKFAKVWLSRELAHRGDDVAL